MSTHTLFPPTLSSSSSCPGLCLQLPEKHQPGTDGWVPIGFSEWSFDYNYGDTALVWETVFEIYDNSQNRDTFAGWAYNGKIIIDKDGKVDVAALASIPVDETFTITLTAVFN